MYKNHYTTMFTVYVSHDIMKFPLYVEWVTEPYKTVEKIVQNYELVKSIMDQ